MKIVNHKTRKSLNLAYKSKQNSNVIFLLPSFFAEIHTMNFKQNTIFSSYLV